MVKVGTKRAIRPIIARIANVILMAVTLPMEGSKAPQMKGAA